MSDDDLNKVIAEVANAINASSVKDMGKVMKGVMQKISGQADGTRVKNLVTAFLNK